MNANPSYSIFPLGDAALVIDFGNSINEQVNQYVLHLFHTIKKQQPPFIIDLVPAYSSLAIYYDVKAVYRQKEDDKTAFEVMAEWVESFTVSEIASTEDKKRLIRVPVCYHEKFATDILYIARVNKITVEEIIELHTGATYTIFMIGFLPGFAYMGLVDERIAIPRKPQPEPVHAGAVGIAGRQTGIYPIASPGGWQVVGRTPISLFNINREQPVLFQPGDSIKFYPITEDEFTHYKSGSA